MDRGAWRANVPGVTKSRTGEATKTSNKADTRRVGWGHQKLGEAGGTLPWSLRREPCPAHTSMSDPSPERRNSAV